jgi:hypothetical protein
MAGKSGEQRLVDSLKAGSFKLALNELYRIMRRVPGGDIDKLIDR